MKLFSLLFAVLLECPARNSRPARYIFQTPDVSSFVREHHSGNADQIGLGRGLHFL